jgi:prepilin-type N-terminal cleavage/methylation domain-containing protein
MNKRIGFTLVELLVVVAIIAMLLAVLMPTMQKAQEQAKNIVCRNNIKQWGTVLFMYANTYDGRFMPGFTVATPGPPPRGGMWMLALRPFYQGVDKIRLCPKATKFLSITGIGNTGPFTAWGVYGDPGYANGWVPYWGVAGLYGSYGINNWIHDPAEGTVTYPENYWRKTNAIKNPSDIPAFGDSVWEGTIVFHTDKVPGRAPGVSSAHDGMWNFCIPRHQLAVNWAFLDNSARKVPIKELWKQRWSPTFDTSAQPLWPAWVSKRW